MLTLTIKKQWFDMICSGAKREEYREITPYYNTRFESIGLLDSKHEPTGKLAEICLRNGYSIQSPSLMVRVRLRKGEGKLEWGAEKGKQYFVLEILAKAVKRHEP